MTNGVTTAAPRLESGLVRLARRGTSALSKRRAKNSWTNDREKVSVSPNRPASEGLPPALLHKILDNLLLVRPGCTLLTVPNKRQHLSATITLPAFAPPEKVNVLL